MTPVFIPSKGRATGLKTSAHFEDKSHVFVVVEPQDEAAYKEAGHTNLLVLPKDNQGIAYVRNWILENAIKERLKRYWMMDDDITQFSEYAGAKGTKITGDLACYKAEKILVWGVPKLGQGAMEYTQFAWSQKKEIVSPGYCDVAVLINPALVGNIRYRSEMNLKEDRDFTLQILASGVLTARSGKIAFAAPKNGSNAGGLADEYAKLGREAEASKRMIKAWPGVCSDNVKNDGRPDVKINWKAACNYKKS